MRIQQILVPVDFSDSSKEAVDFAQTLAQKFGAKLILLHAFEPPAPAVPSGFFDTAPLRAAARASAERLLDAFRSQRANLDPNVPVAAVLVEQSPAPAIIEYAGQHSVDMIVLGSHGHTALRQLLLGGVAEKVVRHAPCPVLMVRPKEKYEPVSRPPDPPKK